MEATGRVSGKGAPPWLGPVAWVCSALQGAALVIALGRPEAVHPIWLYIMVLGFATLFASPMILWEAWGLVRQVRQGGEAIPLPLSALIAAHAAATLGLLVFAAWRVLR